MAQHPNVLKVRKQSRKGRRAYLTNVYSLMHVPRSVGKGHIPEDSQALFDYRARGKSTYDPYLNAIFPGRISPPSDWNAESIEKFTKPNGEAIPVNAGERNGRKFALDRAEEERIIQMLSDQDIIDFYVVKTETKMQPRRITLHYNRLKTRFYLVEINYVEKWIRRSRTYGGEERTLFNLEHNRVEWVDHAPLDSLTLVLPRRGG